MQPKRWFACDLGLTAQRQILLYIDNNAALQLTRNPGNYARAKHIEIRHHFLRSDGTPGHYNIESTDKGQFCGHSYKSHY